MNHIVLMGRLTKDPSIYGEEDKKVAKFNLAVDRMVAKEDAKTDFINIVAFGKKAEFAEKYLKKGTKIVLSGRLQTGSYVKDGDKVYTMDVVAETIEFAESKKSEGAAVQENKTEGGSETGLDLSDFMSISPETKDDMPF